MLRPYKNRDSYPEITKEGLLQKYCQAQKKRLGVLPCFDPKRFFVLTFQLTPHTRQKYRFRSLTRKKASDTFVSDTGWRNLLSL